MSQPTIPELQPQDSSELSDRRKERTGRVAAALGAVSVALVLGAGAYQQIESVRFQINPSVDVGVIDDIQSGNVDLATVTEWTDALKVAPKTDPANLPPIVQQYKQ